MTRAGARQRLQSHRELIRAAVAELRFATDPVHQAVGRWLADIDASFDEVSQTELAFARDVAAAAVLDPTELPGPGAGDEVGDDEEAPCPSTS